MREYFYPVSFAKKTLGERIAWLTLLRDGRPGDPGYPMTWDEVHRTVTEVMGRPVWSHEIAFIGQLIIELRRGTPADFQEILENVPAEKRVVVVVANAEPPASDSGSQS